MKKILVIAAAALLSLSSYAQDAPAKPQFKWYGFIRTYFAFDTRESSAGTEDLYFYMPKAKNMVGGEDLNAIPSFRYAALTSRLGLDVVGYEVLGYKIGAKIETDFYSGVSGVTGTATLRLRQAYVTLAKANRTWKIGQAWHPMAADLPDIFSLESGAPFGPFSRTPQITADINVSDAFGITASALWQMQYTSTGPDGASANYIKYSCTPELYLGFNFKTSSSLYRVGAEMLSIKPRNFTETGTKVNDRLTTFNAFVYGQQKAGDWTFKEKVTYANDGSHMNLVGGYGVSGINPDGSWTYSATRSLSGWATMTCKKSKTWVPSMLIGYIKEFGTAKDVTTFWCKNSANSVNQMFRIQPEIVYNLGKLGFGLEYMCTAVQYGKSGANKLADTDLYWIANHRIQAMVKYTF